VLVFGGHVHLGTSNLGNLRFVPSLNEKGKENPWERCSTPYWGNRAEIADKTKSEGYTEMGRGNRCGTEGAQRSGRQQRQNAKKRERSDAYRPVPSRKRKSGKMMLPGKTSRTVSLSGVLTADRLWTYRGKPKKNASKSSAWLANAGGIPPSKAGWRAPGRPSYRLSRRYSIQFRRTGLARTSNAAGGIHHRDVKPRGNLYRPQSGSGLVPRSVI